LVEEGSAGVDPRTPPVAFVIAILTAVVVISAFGARRYFAHKPA
jgi:hypothetical protein